MDGNEVIKAVEVARAELEGSGFDVEDVILHAAVRGAEGEKVDYVMVSYTDPKRMDTSVRRRFFDSLVTTAEALGFGEESDD